MDQQQENHLNYDYICRIIGDIYLKSFETLKKQNKEADSLRLALQKKIDSLTSEVEALKGG